MYNLMKNFKDGLMICSLGHLKYFGKFGLLFALFYFNLIGQIAYAQIVQHDGILGDTTIIAPKLDCNLTPGILYRDDNLGGVALYNDATARKDTLTICPETQWDVVTITFAGGAIFDVAAGDTLCAYDGDVAAVRTNAAGILIGKASGIGNAKAFGGWVTANCDPGINSTGCLTFIFKTNGDSIKANGWEAWASCNDRGITIESPSNQDYQASCSVGEPAPITNIPILAADIKGNCTLANRNIRVTITNLHTNTQCLQEVALPNAAIPSSPIKLAPGVYQVIHALQVDTFKRDTQYIKVGSPSLVCNDEVNLGVDASCRTLLDIDGLLEGDTCVGSGVNYHIIIKNDAGEIITQGRQLSLDSTQIDNLCGLSLLTATVVRTIKYAGSTALCKPDSLVATCDVKINFKDESNPYFNRDTSRIDTLVACDASVITEKVLTAPIVLDNCGDTLDASFSITPIKVSYAACEYPREYLITWTAKDSCENATIPLVDTIRIIRPTEFSAAQSITEDCAKEANGLMPLISRARVRPGLRTGKMVNGAFTATGTIRLSHDTSICKYILAILDSTDIMGPCGKRYAEIRWGYLDLCDLSKAPVEIDTQRIRFIDESAPTLSDSTLVSLSDIQDSTSTKGRFDIRGADCNFDFSNIVLPVIPKATDNCATEENIQVIIKNVQQLVNGKWDTIAINLAAAIAADTLRADTFRVAYEASESCSKKVSQVFSHFILEYDDSTTAPTIVCEDELHVSLNEDNGVKIKADDLIVSKKAACNRTIDTLLVRRKGTSDWAEAVVITCEDIGNPFDIEVQIRDDKENINSCWTSIYVEDKIAPICQALPDTMGICTDFHSDELGKSTDKNDNGILDDEWVELDPDEAADKALLDLYNTKFGNPLTACLDNLIDCNNHQLTQQFQLVNEACGVVNIKRRYRLADASSNHSEWKEQNITIKYVPSWTMQFPEDESVNCGETLPDTLLLTDMLTTGTCDLFGYTVEDKVYEVTEDACLKIERTYEIINWCVYEVGDPIFIIPNDPTGNATLNYEAVGEDSGHFSYTQVIKLQVNEAPTISINPVETCIYGVGDALPYGEADNSTGQAPYECDTLRTFSATASNCLGNSISNFIHHLKVDGVLVIENGQGGSFDYMVEPNRTYEVEFWAFDECGNSKGLKETIKFEDCKAPTAYLIDGIAVTLGEGGTVLVWAADLDLGSWDNCSPKGQLERRIALGDVPVNNTASALALEEVLALNCDNLGSQLVTVVIIDEAGNFSKAIVTIEVQVTGTICNGANENMAKVSGQVQTADGANIAAVTVNLLSTNNQSITTEEDGIFEFQIEAGKDYNLAPNKDIHPLNGVSTYDLVLISQHILGIQKLDSPYKLIAADINQSKSITAFDIVQLRQLILNIIDEFPDNTSWRFIDKTHDFTTENPLTESFKESISINNLSDNTDQLDFIGVKIGDINGSATANDWTQAEARKGQKIEFANKQCVPRRRTSCESRFIIPNMTQINGFQFALEFADMEIIGMEKGIVKQKIIISFSQKRID